MESGAKFICRTVVTDKIRYIYISICICVCGTYQRDKIPLAPNE